MPRASSRRAPSDLNARLRARRPEIEQAALSRIHAIAEPATTPDPTYLSGLRSALTAALDYGLTSVDAPDADPAPVPVELLSQARLAARNGVSLDAVMRRYSAGHSLLADTMIEEAAAAGLSVSDLRAVLRGLSARFDQVVAAVSEEYGREAGERRRSSTERRVQLVERLLAGELLDTAELSYGFEGWHLGLIVLGSAEDAIRDLATSLNRRTLIVARDREPTWAWLGGGRPFESGDLGELGSYPWPIGARVAIGEPSEGPVGWRLTHRQAEAALPIALRGRPRVARYADAPLLASALHDDLLAASLHSIYLDPLRRDRNEGATAKSTLRAYFAAGGNASSAAADLGINRRTVASRLTAIEERIGRSVDDSSAEIETALRLDAFESDS